MGDSCCAEWSMGAIKQAIEQELPGVYVLSIATGTTQSSDVLSSYFGNANEQVAQVCHQLAQAPELRHGFVAIGFSQGGQLLRAAVQRCQHLLPGKVHTLVTMGSQHQGVMDVPGCVAPAPGVTPGLACRAMQAMLGWGAYVPLVQRHVIQAQYFKDPYHMQHYLSSSLFLADINVESPASASSVARYRDNLASLHRLVLWLFEQDDMVVPKESSHFGVFHVDAGRVLPMNETALYTEDRIGLRALDTAGRLVLERVPGRHMHISLEWFAESVVKRYLAVPVNGSSSGGGNARHGPQ